jgi:hypothetical protein
VSESAAAECRRVCIAPRCLCESLMCARERQRLGRKEAPKPSNPLTRMSWHERRAIYLLKSLGPEQLELFVGWQRKCIRLGVIPSAEDAFDYLSEMREAA